MCVCVALTTNRLRKEYISLSRLEYADYLSAYDPRHAVNEGRTNAIENITYEFQLILSFLLVAYVKLQRWFELEIKAFRFQFSAIFVSMKASFYFHKCYRTQISFFTTDKETFAYFKELHTLNESLSFVLALLFSWQVKMVLWTGPIFDTKSLPHLHPLTHSLTHI